MQQAIRRKANDIYQSSHLGSDIGSDTGAVGDGTAVDHHNYNPEPNGDGPAEYNYNQFGKPGYRPQRDYSVYPDHHENQEASSQGNPANRHHYQYGHAADSHEFDHHDDDGADDASAQQSDHNHYDHHASAVVRGK